VLDAGTDVVLIDNFELADLKKALVLIGDRAATEASGCVTKKKLPALGKLGLDYISSGALVHHAVWADIGLDWR
jgi:nicotinate-nucleotide pyrophosphorylase (carboxylating)